MIPHPASKRYFDRAQAAANPSWRTVYMLGQMCAAAVDHGTLVAFVGRGYGADWPDPRHVNNRTAGSGAISSPQRD